jgi:crossover junction endodeoxyribonuclease RuvC
VKVLGIDPGTAACGYGVVQTDGGDVSALDFGWWRSTSGERLELRLRRIHDGVAALIATHGPEAVALEESYVGADARTALAVGQARGAVLVACAYAEVECREYPPATVKQSVCGYGRADKRQVQRMVKAILGLEAEPAPSHVADALAVAICHAQAPPLQRRSWGSGGGGGGVRHGEAVPFPRGRARQGRGGRP